MILDKKITKNIKSNNGFTIKYLIECDVCKKQFTSKRDNQKYCTNSCRYIAKKQEIVSKEIIKKRNDAIKKYYKNNKQWNYNLTKENDSRVKKISESIKNSPIFRSTIASKEYKEKISSACKGKKNGFYGKKHTKKSKEKMSDSRSKGLSNGTIHITNSRGLKGWYHSIKMNDDFYYDSFWELARMKILDIDKEVISWTKKHGLRILYFNEINRYYIPDFLIEYKDGSRIIEEIKGKDDGYKNETNLKLLALKKYCKENNLTWIILRGKEINDLCHKFLNKSINTLRKHFKNEK